EYDTATESFVRAAMSQDRGGVFLDDFASFRQKVAHLGAINSLSQQLLKLTAPGVPDLYQGTECWDFSLVDPDNRRPVDFEARRAAFSALRRRKPGIALATELLEGYEDGRIKLYVTQRALEVRQSLRNVFSHGEYERIEITGTRAEHVVAFARRHESGDVIVAVPRLVAELTGSEPGFPLGEATWGDTRLVLPPETHGWAYRDVFTGVAFTANDGDRSSMALATLFNVLPLALLVRQ
ncbi:MAG: malto-oligosyltrehalose synthase, partial [Thermomicrobiales bacterium]